MPGKRLLVIGAVAAGTKAAAKARREDSHLQITVLTQEDDVSYAGCGTPYFIGDLIKSSDELVVRSPDDFKTENDIDILIHHRATKIDIKSKSVTVVDLVTNKETIFDYDKLVIATGASPIIPPIPGIDGPNIYSLRSISDAVRIKKALALANAKTAVVVGGGYIGLEMAENLTRWGLAVTLVEKLDQVLVNLDPDMAWLVMQHLIQKGVTVMLNNGVQEFRQDHDGRVRVVTEKGELAADLVVMGIGIRPNVKLAADAGIQLGETGAIKVNERMETNVADVYAAGDCVEEKHLVSGRPVWIGLGSTANKQGRVAGINVTGGNDTFPGILGTMIVKVFDLSAGKTGLTEKECRRLGYETEFCIVPGMDKAHYYPGAKSVVIKLVAEKPTGRLLGCQVVGPGAADKRIDIAATAIAAGMTAEQLSKLDLAYAPPYSMALEALLVAANVMTNKLTGRLKGISVDQVQAKQKAKEDFIIVDVRAKEERDASRIEGSVHIPLEQLKGRVNELPKDKEIVTHCARGLRSAEAYRILRSAGFADVKSMDGGMRMWRK